MRSYDDWKQTEPEVWSNGSGVPCDLCGTEATWAPKIQGDEKPVPLCDTCARDHVTDCPDCGVFFWMQNGYRVFSTPTLYCPACAQTFPHVVADLARSHRLDEERERRRVMPQDVIPDDRALTDTEIDEALAALRRKMARLAKAQALAWNSLAKEAQLGYLMEVDRLEDK